jgi:hypothetical protein
MVTWSRAIVEVSVMCQHQQQCASADAPDHATARVLVAHPEQGWSLLCNRVVVFDDWGELLPDGRAVSPLMHASSPAA